MITIAFIVFFLLAALYASLSAAVMYHLRAYVLPGWNAGRVSIWFFVICSAILFLISAYYFFQVPWDFYFTGDANPRA